ncbi:hypothetical protein B0H10DRAFT_1961579 [Mycena sp. CBHHK59/15]|nr:hypothetical protein B0H10DRAFT_1961579 [Mycena sp. CBHHK59/15]
MFNKSTLFFFALVASGAVGEHHQPDEGCCQPDPVRRPRLTGPVQVQQIAEPEHEVQFGVQAGGIFAERIRTPNLKHQDGNTFQQIYAYSGVIYVGILAPHHDPMSLFVPDVEWVRTHSNAELNLNLRSGSRFGSSLNWTSGSGSAFGKKCPEPEPNRTLPSLGGSLGSTPQVPPERHLSRNLRPGGLCDQRCRHCRCQQRLCNCLSSELSFIDDTVNGLLSELDVQDGLESGVDLQLSSLADNVVQAVAVCAALATPAPVAQDDDETDSEDADDDTDSGVCDAASLENNLGQMKDITSQILFRQNDASAATFDQVVSAINDAVTAVTSSDFATVASKLSFIDDTVNGLLSGLDVQDRLESWVDLQLSSLSDDMLKLATACT